jgi:poly(A) polymerase
MMVSEPQTVPLQPTAEPVDVASFVDPVAEPEIEPEIKSEMMPEPIPLPEEPVEQVEAAVSDVLESDAIFTGAIDTGAVEPVIDDFPLPTDGEQAPEVAPTPPETYPETDVEDEVVEDEISDEPAPERQPSAFAISRDQHSVSRKHISQNALSVLYRLHESGYRALLVGGGVRDVLLGRAPKDFDIATDATPEQIRRLFRNCRLIGRRFRLAHVIFGRDVIEVATFRASGEDVPGRTADESGRLLRDNVYGTIEDDVPRRDFTVNALYYDIADFSVLDHVGGMQDLRDGVLRLLGDPETRYREDPVRMLRAARFAAKLGFQLHADTERPLAELASLLAGIPPARLFDECFKLFHTGHGEASLRELMRFDLLRWLLPPLHEALEQMDDDGGALRFVQAALANTDQRVADGLPLSTAFLFAALLWPVVIMLAQREAHAGQPDAVLIQHAGDEVLREVQAHIAIPRHLQLLTREIWEMQVRFVVHQGRGVASLHGHPRFRAAYDFLLLRAQVGEPQAVEDAAWWQAFVEAGSEDQQAAQGVGSEGGRSKRRRAPRRRKSTETDTESGTEAVLEAGSEQDVESDAELDYETEFETAGSAFDAGVGVYDDDFADEVADEPVSESAEAFVVVEESAQDASRLAEVEASVSEAAPTQTLVVAEVIEAVVIENTEMEAALTPANIDPATEPSVEGHVDAPVDVRVATSVETTMEATSEARAEGETYDAIPPPLQR